jgi:hypothetical protein
MQTCYPFKDPRLPAVAIILAAAGCVMPGDKSTRARLASVAATNVSKEELHDVLDQFADTFEAAIRQASDQITARNPDRRTRRLVLMWQMQLIPMLRDAVNQDDAIRGFLDAWTLCVRMRQFLTEGDGRDLFGAAQPIAAAAAERCEADIEHIAATYLPRERVTATRDAIIELAGKFPLRGEFSGAAVRTAVQQADKENAVLQSVLNLPMAPFRAFEGIDRGAVAIQGFTQVAARMTDVVQGLPQDLRLQSELLAMQMEDLESVQSAMTSFRQLSESSARLAAVAERLPEELRRELAQAMEDLDARQGNLQKTLGEAQAASENVRHALERATETARAIDQTAVNTARAGEAWTGTFRSITEMVESFRSPDGQTPAPPGDGAAPGSASAPAESPGAPPPSGSRQATGVAPAAPASTAAAGPPEDSASGSRPFDILDYAQTADSLDRAALQMQKLTGNIRDLAGSAELTGAVQQLDGHVRELIQLTHGRAAELADRITWRAVQLALLIFALAVAYRFIAGRAPRSKPA